MGMWNDEATFLVAKQALDRVGLNREDLDAVVISTMDGLDGITISNGLLVPAAGAYEKDSIRIETTGLHCVVAGVATILSDNADLVMLASSDTIETDFNYITNANQDQFFRGPLGFNPFQSYGLLAMDYLRRSKATEDDFASAASKNYQCGSANPYAHITAGYTVDEITDSPMVSWPLRSLEIARPSNGAAAILLASEEKAKEVIDNPVWITGLGASTNSYCGSWPELCGMVALKKAAKKAFHAAGIKDPKKDLDFLEISNPFSTFELIAYESLRICEDRKGAELLREGMTSPDGDLPVNISGGSLCAHGLNSSGIYRIVQAMMLLNNERSDVNMKHPKRGLVHDSDMTIGAVGGDSHAILIMERES
jgi:acetyl-CoA C-acetyltransferase